MDAARAISLVDLTTLEASDTDESVRALARRAMDPAGDGSLPSVAAVCVYPRFASPVAATLSGSGVGVACVAGAFPSGRAVVDVKVAEIRRAVDDGASEIDTVLPWAELLAGDEDRVAAELAALREAASGVRLKVILETGSLLSEKWIRRGSLMALRCGADMIKTSTGKSGTGATPAAAEVMAKAIREFGDDTRGLKVSGGVRTQAEAEAYAAIVCDVLGEPAVTPDRFRIGASSLLDALVGGAAP